jgi:outer membrane lipoprotein SlyB
LSHRPFVPILEVMRSVIGLCATLGTVVGGYVPSLWGSGSFSLGSVVFAAVGGIAGVWLGVRLSSV